MTRILIIEDDEDIAFIEKDYLEVSGYQVTVEINGIKGLTEALTGEYDLILLDVMLPGMDGFQICRKLRNKLDIPIMMVTAKRTEIEQIRGLGFAVKLDTNGTNPDMLEALAQEGLLDYAAMDIKNSPDRYAETCGGVDLLGPVKRSATLLMAGAVDYEFRSTVCAPLHTPEEMAGIGRWLKGAKRYFLQPFVDSGELVGSGMKPLTKEEIEALRDSVLPDIPSTQIRGQ